MGVIREYDLKTHAYAQFGRDLIKRQSVQEFLHQTLTVLITISKKDLLNSSAKNPNPDGIVLTENDSVKALNRFRTNATDFDLIVTDQTMPVIIGISLAKEILRISPTIPVILFTGYSECVSPEQAREAGIHEYVLKPPDFRKLASSIQRLAFSASS
jgi:CheY-like chemotaxis protein